VHDNHFLAVGCGLNDCSCLASDFVVLVLSEALLSEALLSEALLSEALLSETVLSETVLVLDGCLNCGDADR
jgi:uncharacterized protein YjbI with pentapeptide repeats